MKNRMKNTLLPMLLLLSVGAYSQSSLSHSYGKDHPYGNYQSYGKDHPCDNGHHNGDKHCHEAPLSATPLLAVGMLLGAYWFRKQSNVDRSLL